MWVRTAAQVARWLQVSEKSVYRWATLDPTMPALRIGGVLRFPRERLERWVRSREQGSGVARRFRQPAPSDAPGPVKSMIRSTSSEVCAIPPAKGHGSAVPEIIGESG